MTRPLFSTYSQRENQVTGTLLTVFEHLGTAFVEDVLETALDESDLSLVTFESQFVAEGSTPDAVIRSSVSLYIETKVEPGVLNRDQLERHLSALDDEASDMKRLIVLTPDATEPAVIDDFDSEEVVWISFDGLVSALEGVLSRDAAVSADQTRPLTERETFLVRELIRFIHESELSSGVEDRVLVIPARRAWDEFEEYGLYFCQPHRSFRPSSYLAFYRDNRIERKIPRITGSVERIELTSDGIERAYEREDISGTQRDELLDTIENLAAADSERYGGEHKVLFLDEDAGFSLDAPIRNDKTAKDSDTRVAFVYDRRYVSAERLRESPESTTQLED